MSTNHNNKFKNNQSNNQNNTWFASKIETDDDSNIPLSQLNQDHNLDYMSETISLLVQTIDDLKSQFGNMNSRIKTLENSNCNNE